MANAWDANNPHGIFYIFIIFVEKNDLYENNSQNNSMCGDACGKCHSQRTVEGI